MPIFYSFDTSSLLNGRRGLLPPETFRTPWIRIEEMIGAGAIRAVDVVRDELSRKDDEVAKWAAGLPSLFVPLEVDIQRATSQTLAAHPKLVGTGGGRNGQPRASSPPRVRSTWSSRPPRRW